MYENEFDILRRFEVDLKTSKYKTSFEQDR